MIIEWIILYEVRNINEIGVSLDKNDMWQKRLFIGETHWVNDEFF